MKLIRMEQLHLMLRMVVVLALMLGSVLPGGIPQSAMAEDTPEETTSPPEDVRNLDWSLIDYNRVQLQWEKPLLPDGTGEDPNIEKYEIYEAGSDAVFEETQDTHVVIGDLAPKRIYNFIVKAVNAEGERSSGERTYPGTSPQYSAELASASIGGDDDRMLALSADGSTLLLASGAGSSIYEYKTATGVLRALPLTEDGEPLNESINGLSVSGDGSAIVFATASDNLKGIPQPGGDKTVYAYDVHTDKLQAVSQPGARSTDPSISADGKRIVYVEDSQIYLYEKQSNTRILVSANTESLPSDDFNYRPVISADGKFIAYYSTASDLAGVPADGPTQSLIVYDAEAHAVDSYSQEASSYNQLAISEDGSRIAFIARYSGFAKPHVFDRITGETKYLNNDRPQSEDKNKSYSGISISGDGRTVAADLLHHDKAPGQASAFGERFDLAENQDGGIVVAKASQTFNPAYTTARNTLDRDGKRLYLLNVSTLYVECSEACGSGGPGGGVQTLSWSVPGDAWAGNELRQGTTLNLQATGQPSLALEAIVDYSMLSESGPPEKEQALVQLTEDPQAAGVYRGQWQPPAGTSAVDKLSAREKNAGDTVSAPGTPIRIAGTLRVTLSGTEALPEAMTLTATHEGKAPVSTEIRPGAQTYDLPLATGTAYAVKLLAKPEEGEEIVLASASGVQVTGGAVTPLALTPTLPATLRVKVELFGEPTQELKVVFKQDGSDETFAEVKPDENGIAMLPGSHTAGEAFKVSIAVPAGYVADAEQRIVLRLGANAMRLTVKKEDAAVQDLFMIYERLLSGGTFESLPVQDSDAMLVVQSDAGQQLAADVNYLFWENGNDGEPVKRTARITLSEQEGTGRYEGSFRIIAGVSRIESARVIYNGHAVDRDYAIGKNVAGRMIFRMPEPANPLEGWESAAAGSWLKVAYFKDRYMNYSANAILGDDLTLTFDVPFPGIEYAATLMPKNGSALSILQFTAKQTGYGRSDVIEIPAAYHVALAADLRFEDGAEGGAKYWLTDPAGAVVSEGTAWIGRDSTLRLPLKLSSGGTYRLKVLSNDPAYQPAEQPIVIDRINVNASVTLQPKPLGKLEGVVKGKDGKAAADAQIVAELLDDGKSKLFYTKTNASGSYSLQLPQGQILIRAIAGSSVQGYQSQQETVRIAAGQTAQKALQILDYADVGVKLYTLQPGGTWQGPIAIDALVAGTYKLGSDRIIQSLQSRMNLRALPGETVQICADGRDLRLSAECKSVVIGEDGKAEVELRLKNESSKAAVRLLGKDGQPLTSAFVELFDSEGDYIPNINYNLAPDEERGILALQGSGSYKATFYANGGFAEISFSTSQGETTDLGVVALQPYGAFASGKVKQAVTVSDTKVAPGSTTTLRVLYQNYYAQSFAAEDAEIVVALPAGAEPVEGTAVVAGKAASYKMDGRNLILPVGTVADDKQQSAQIKLRFDEAVGDAPALQASIRYKVKGEPTSELLGMAVLSKVRVSLRAPSLTVKRQLSLGGSAPAGASVTIYDGRDPIGTAMANKDGLWWADATLTGSDGVYMEHRLSVEAVEGAGARVSGEEAVVVYDPNDPGLVSMTILSNHKEVTFNVEGGVAVFPLSVVTNAPIAYRLNFRDPERVYDVRVQNGDTLSQAAKGADGVYRGVMPFSKSFGQVWIDYRTKADSVELAARPAIAEEELRSSLPAALRDFAMPQVTNAGEETPGGERLPEGAFEAEVELAEGVTSTIRGTFESVAYTASDKDLAWQSSTGLPVYRFKESHSETKDGSLQTSISFVIPSSASASARGIQGASVGGIAITLSGLIKFGEAGFKGWSAAKAGQDTLANYRRAQDLLKAAEAICEPEAREYYTGFAKEVVFEVNAHFTVSNMLKVVKNFGKIDKGPGVLFSAASEYASMTFKEVENNDMDELEEHIKKYTCKLKPYPPTDRKDPPAASPKYIWDPSGYVYEGMPSNRVEGATATVMELVGDVWTVWDSEWYGQENPQSTDREGRYGWDVPEGKWKVRYEKDGYETAYSDALDVPPPQLEVNVPIVSYAAPEVQAVHPAPGGAGVTVYFTKPVNVDTLEGAFALKDSGAANIDGTIEAKDIYTSKDGLSLAMAAEFVPGTALRIGEGYTLTVRGTVQSYARVPIGEDWEATFTVEASDSTPPADVSALAGGMTDEGVVLTWRDPSDKDLAAVNIYWKKAADAAYGYPVTVSAGTMWGAVPGLDASSAYEFKAAAVDEAGNEARGVAFNWTPQSVADLTAPMPISELAAKAQGDSAIRMTWTDSSSVDLAKLRIEWRISGSEDKYATAEVEKGKGEFTANGLKPLTEYELRVFAVDASGNESKPVGVSASTGASGQSGGPSGSGGGGQTDPNEETGDLGEAGASLSFFGGKLKLQLPGSGGAAGAAKKVTVSKAQNSPAPADTHLRLLSDVYAWKLEASSQLSAVAKLTIAYDSAKLDGGDIRKLGLYRQDAADKTRWTYVGGVVDGAAGTVEAESTEPGAYAVLVAEYTFGDLANHWSRGDVEVLAARGIVTGDPDGSFRPNGKLTRAEFVKLLLPLFADAEADRASSAPFTDVPQEAWYAEAVEKAAAAGIVQGADGKFRPTDPVTREEMAVMLYRALGIVTDDLDPEKLLSVFNDGAKVSGWARMQVAYAVKAGLLKGSGGRLHPGATATRAEAATVLLRVLEAQGKIMKKE
ncbi:S-layer homology domain-containing protein [Cohnella hashimotonis]|uniref:S-layer homology domain-containing protein n=1 Tax=Cohnella hashimotonis TaxID=2826895 RepID=A0ABT6TAQ3_9BACL|nr:S-layer homology domain-containing protein [Cohnella hashimotonis]MDI4643911.1 S-layer homology domain-containing protein [Cohnella hashimotonis]